jgi:hypothetical protein
MSYSRTTPARLQALTRASTVILPLCVLLFCGCDNPFAAARKPVHHELLSFHTTSQAANLRRVAILPFYMAFGVGRSAQTIDEAMSASMRELALNEIETVALNQRDLLLPEDPMVSNHISLEDLLKIRDTLHCDGVLIGRVEQYDSFDPISIGVSAHMISCLDGSVVWSATGQFDGHRDDVQEEIEDWYEHSNGASTANISGWKVVLQSPRLFTRYVTDRLAQSIPIIPPTK